MVVKVKWFYHPEETKGGKRLLEMQVGTQWDSFMFIQFRSHT